MRYTELFCMINSFREKLCSEFHVK